MFVRLHKFIPLLATLLVAIAFTATAYTFNPSETQRKDLDVNQIHSEKEVQIESSKALTKNAWLYSSNENDLIGRRVEPTTNLCLNALLIEEESIPGRTFYQFDQLSSIQNEKIKKTKASYPLYDHPKLHSKSYSNHHDLATTCTVTTSADNGAGSLRQCLLNVTLSDTIKFDSTLFSLATPTTITLLSTLPPIITDGLTIDAHDAGVVLNGNGLTSANDSGFLINGASGVTIQGLQILNFPMDGITVRGGASHTLIGGDTQGAGNLISGNGNTGIWLEGGTHSQIKGNYIGTDSTGMISKGNNHGIVVLASAQNNIIGDKTEAGRNLISGNLEVGVLLLGSGTTNNQILGNYIGTDVTGMTSVSNTNGIIICAAAQNNLIGGENEATHNLISGNINEGIVIQDEGTNKNKVQGNYIGTDKTGASALGNENGILILDKAQNNLIGGSELTRNLISGNARVGIWFRGDGTSDNKVQNNYIGTDKSGTVALGNTYGVVISFESDNNLVGGEQEQLLNLMAWFINQKKELDK